MRRLLVLLLLCAPALARAAPIPAPVVRGGDEARAVVERALQRPPRARAPEVWMQDAWEALRLEGWLWAEVAFDPGKGVLHLRPGRRAVLSTVEVGGASAAMVRRFVETSGLVPGAVYRPGAFATACTAGLQRLGDEGHPFASVTVRALKADPVAAAVDLDLLLVTGAEAFVGRIHVEGATHTREGVLARLSGLEPGRLYRESDLEAARDRLESREVVARVEAVQPLLASPGGDSVDVRIRLRQTESTGRVAAALGVTQGEREEGTRLYGSVDLELTDLFGTARRFDGRFRDDGRARRTLDLGYREPLVLGSPLDLQVALGQRHEEERFDTILAEAALGLAWRGATRVDLGLGVDRTSFVGDEGRLRVRRRATARLRLVGRRPEDERGIYGGLDSRLEAVRVAQSYTDPPTGVPAAATETQTVIDSDLRLGWALTPDLALAARGRWAQVLTDRLPIPASEHFYLGGTTTVRGHREDELHGELVSHGSLELVVGGPRAGQAYAFYDLGYRRETLEEGRREAWIRGFGAGLRTPAPFGRLDLSLGFAGRLSFDEGLVHLVLIQDF